MQKKIIGTCFRVFLKLIFIFGSLGIFIGGIWGHDITLDTFSHMFKCFTILCCIAGISYVVGSGFNATGKRSLRHLFRQILACIIGAVVGQILYAYIIGPVVVFLGKLVGGLIIICFGFGAVLFPVCTAAAVAKKQAEALAMMGSDAVLDMIHSGSLKLDSSQELLKSELYGLTGIDYDRERRYFENRW